jgi:hypothetical protein
MAYCWYESYRAAVLETDWTTMQERIEVAETKLLGRQRVLTEGEPTERLELVEALNNLKALRKLPSKHIQGTDGRCGLSLAK